MQKVWLENYPDNVPEFINDKTFSSVADIFNTSCTTYADDDAFENMGKKITFREWAELAVQFAAFLQQHCGLKKGDRIAIMSPNLIQYPVVLYAAFLCGLVVVNVNPLYTPRELKNLLKATEAKAIVILENVTHVLEAVIQSSAIEHVVVTKIGDCLSFPKSHIVNFVVKYVKKMSPAWHIPHAVSWKKAMRLGKKMKLQPVSLSPDDTAFLQFTGGTTGHPVGAELLHRNIVSNVEQVKVWLSPYKMPHNPIIITALPLYHIFALTGNTVLFSSLGAKSVLITNPRDIPGFVKELSKHKFHYMSGVNTLFAALTQNEDFKKLDFSALKNVLGGGASVQHAVAERWEKITGVIIHQAYGLTETSPGAIICPITQKEFTGAIGLPLPSTEIKIIDDKDKVLGIGEVGELCIRGPQVMKGYWQSPEKTAEVLSEDGWFKTGDIVRVDADGYVYLIDRKKDIIVVSGFNVFPNEIEDVVMSHDDVIEVAAIGIPSERTGETVKLFVVRKDDQLTEERLKAFCRTQLTRYKVPTAIEFVDDLPKSNVGKILRRLVREQNLAKHQ